MKVNNLILGLLIADNSTMWGREQKSGSLYAGQ